MPSDAFEAVAATLTATRSPTLPSTADLRRGYDGMGNLAPLPEGTTVTPVDAGGAPAEWVSAYGSPPRRTVLHFHGGGYHIGSPDSHRNLAAHLSAAADARVLMSDYRLAPEHPYPAAQEDAEAAYRWLLDERTPPDRLIVSGDSAGGGLALSLLVRVREAGLPLPAAVVLISPWADLADLGDIAAPALDLDYLRPEQLEAWRDSYATGRDPADPGLSPINADLSGLPPTLVWAGGLEILFDSCRRLSAALTGAGVDASLVVAAGMFHDIPVMAGLFPEADEAIATIADFITERA